MKILNDMNLTTLNEENLMEINGGDGVTEAVFKFLGYAFQSYADDQARRIESGMPYRPGIF
ncbi:MAG: hypothetical protein CMC87_01875 [Flavobacteriaceae bacterium]|nr:hypothetical protein [Flavobacteriaceae bacterium]